MGHQLYFNDVVSFLTKKYLKSPILVPIESPYATSIVITSYLARFQVMADYIIKFSQATVGRFASP